MICRGLDRQPASGPFRGLRGSLMVVSAIGLSHAAREVFPGFPDAGEVMLRRLLHDDHIDAIAAAIAPLGLGWFA